eukprot:GILI01063762.1.p1 GENE.GILI01063762.1~~GILI01063762.1.p1  ORF type:complete len:115 (+),score=13.99 GILI01063762.1:243-587(+)
MRVRTLLKSKGAKEFIFFITSVVSEHQQMFVTKEVAGFLFQAPGQPLLFLRNASHQSPECLGNILLGYVDLTEVRRRFFQQVEMQKLTRVSRGQLAMAGVVGGLLVFSLHLLFK